MSAGRPGSTLARPCSIPGRAPSPTGPGTRATEPSVDVEPLVATFLDDAGDFRLDITVGLDTRSVVSRLAGRQLDAFGVTAARVRSRSADAVSLVATLVMDGTDQFGDEQRTFEVAVDATWTGLADRRAVQVTGEASLIDHRELVLVELRPA